MLSRKLHVLSGPSASCPEPSAAAAARPRSLYGEPVYGAKARWHPSDWNTLKHYRYTQACTKKIHPIQTFRGNPTHRKALKNEPCLMSYMNPAKTKWGAPVRLLAPGYRKSSGSISHSHQTAQRNRWCFPPSKKDTVVTCAAPPVHHRCAPVTANRASWLNLTRT